MQDKKGFTFIEILVGIALIGLVTIMLVPGIVDSFSSSKRNIMKIQEKQISDAAKIYLEDFCVNPINNNVSCPLNYDTDSKGFKLYNDTFDVSTIIGLGYIGDIKLNKSDCEGYIVVEDTTKVKTYLYCGDEYITPGYSGKDEIAIFEFKGYEETFNAPQTGYYSLELYGAQGAGEGGKGGKVYGEIFLNSGESLFIRVGGSNGYNGGGAGDYQGGGASTIKYNNEIIATAAGGGGGKEGTPGGNGNAIGGAYSEGTLDVAASGVAGSNGTNGGGGGSGNKYKDCTEHGEVYNACLTGENTCIPGMINGSCKTYSRCSSCGCETYNSCADASCGYLSCANEACGCQTYNTCENVVCGYKTCTNSACGNKTCQHVNCGVTYSCSSGWTLSGTSCTKAASTRTLYRWYYRKCSCTCTYRYASGPYTCSTKTNSISGGTYYNTPSCGSACSQKNSGTVGTGCNGISKHVSGSGSCSKVYTAWQTSSTKPSSSYNDDWKETTTETYCPSGTLSGSNCTLAATSTNNTCANSACGYLSCATSACGTLSCATSACGCKTFKTCATSACGNKTCATSACGCKTYKRCESCPCEEYNQTYSPCSTGENTCEGGMENKCIAASEEKYNSGNGGTSSIDTSVLSNSSYIHGTRTGNGKIVIKYLGAE